MITRYECEICENYSTDKDEIIRCEARGTLKQEYPIGTIFQLDSIHDDMVMIFAVAKYKQTRHHGDYLTWACRDSKKDGSVLDNIPNCIDEILNPRNTCGFSKYNETYNMGWIPPDTNSPAFKRLKSILDKFGIPITIFKNPKPVQQSDKTKETKVHG